MEDALQKLFFYFGIKMQGEVNMCDFQTYLVQLMGGDDTPTSKRQTLLRMIEIKFADLDKEDTGALNEKQFIEGMFPFFLCVCDSFIWFSYSTQMIPSFPAISAKMNGGGAFFPKKSLSFF